MRLNSTGRKLVIALATVFGVVLTANLGFWQLRRADQKLAFQAALEQRATLPELAATDLADSAAAATRQHYRRIRLHGRWIAAATVFLDNRQMDGHPGFYVVTPLKLDGSAATVLVHRGWAPRNSADRMQLPAVVTPAGDVVVAGHVAPPPARLYEFDAAASGVIRQNLDPVAYGRETGLALAPLSIVQDAAPGTVDDGLQRRWARPAVDVQMHHGYAFQWFALCALMAGLYVWFQLVRPRLGNA